MITRRTFLAGATAVAAGAMAPRIQAAQSPRKKVAFLGTEVRLHSHAQHFLDRMTLGYAWRGGWQAAARGYRHRCSSINFPRAIWAANASNAIN